MSLSPQQSQALANANALNQSMMDLANNISNIKSQQKQDENIEWQKDFSESQASWQQQWAEKQFEYQKFLNETTMSREDNAIQRRAADLAAAGLNPNLAVGQPAQSQGFGGAGSAGVVGSNLGQRFNPKFSSGSLDAQMRLAQLGQVQHQNELLAAQERYYDALSGKVSAETSALPSTTEEINARGGYYRSMTSRLIHDLEIERDRGIRSVDNGQYALIQQAISALQSFMERNHFPSPGDIADGVYNRLMQIPDVSKSAAKTLVDKLRAYFETNPETGKFKVNERRDSAAKEALDDLVNYFKGIFSRK